MVRIMIKENLGVGNMVFVILFVGGICAYEAIQEFKAEKYVQEKKGKDVDFSSYMIGHHPLSFLWIIAAVIFICILIFS